MGHSLHDWNLRPQYAAHVSWTPDHAVSVLKSDGLRSVWLVQRPGEEPRTVKFWPVSSWMLAKHAMGISQPIRQDRGCRRLRGAGIDTPKIVSGPMVTSVEGRRVIRLELDHVPGRTVLEHLECGSVDAAAVSEVARQVGALVCSIADAGFMHRDLKLSNIVVEEFDDATPKVWVIDPVGVRQCRNRSVAIFRMLERLDVEIRSGRDIAGIGWSSVVREAMRPLSPSERRAVLSMLRARPRP